MLLGFLTADKGQINLFDAKDGSVILQDRIGYIPENVNLYPYLTGVENLDYFSKLAGLKFTLEELLKFLLNVVCKKKLFINQYLNIQKGCDRKLELQ